jgi:hypothetical protein
MTQRQMYDHYIVLVSYKEIKQLYQPQFCLTPTLPPERWISPYVVQKEKLGSNRWVLYTILAYESG